MTRLKFLFDEEEEKGKFGWEQRTRGIGELPEFPKSTKLKFTADVGLGVGAKGVSLVVPEIEPPIGVSQRMRGIGEIPKKYPFEGVTIDMKKAQKRFGQLWRSEFMTTENKWKFLRHENWSEELIQANRESMILSEKASKMGVNIKDWINYGVYMVFFASMAASILPIVSGLPKNILNNLAYKVEGKTVKGKELLKVLQRVTYPDPRAGFGAPSKFDKKIFDEFVKQGGLRGIGKNLKTGITITEIEPRFAFKLYAGLPADEIVKSLVKTGKVTADIARELSLAKPELVSQVIQNLSVASPAIASKLAPELVKLIPEVKEEIPLAKPEVKPKVNPMAFSNDPLAISRELESYPDDSILSARKAELIFKQHLEGKEIDYPINIAKQELELAKTNLIEKFGNDYPEAEKIIKRAEILERQLPEITKIVKPPEVEPKEYVSAPKSAKTFRAERRIEKRADDIGLLAKFNYENKIWEVWEVEDTKAFIKEPTEKVYEGRKVEEFLKDYKAKPKVEIKYVELKPGEKVTREYLDRVAGLEKKEEIPKVEVKEPESLEEAIKSFEKKFKDKNLIYRNINSGELKEGTTKKVRNFTTDLDEAIEFAEITAKQQEDLSSYLVVAKKPLKIEPRGDKWLSTQIKSGDIVDIYKMQWDKEQKKWEFTSTQAKPIPIEPVKPVEKIEPEVKREVIEEEIPKVEVATPKQIKKAHAIANSKALISEKGKMKPQYRKIAEVFTGKRSVKDMTPEEAEMFIDQLDRLPEPKYRAGKLVPPSIPRTMKLTTLDFFKKVYGEPTPIWLLTDQTYYATKLGIKPLVEPYEKGKMGFDLEFRKSSYLVDKIVNKLNTIAKTPGWERVKSKIKNIPTKAESKMAELLNKHETTPPGLTSEEEDVFRYFRNLSKDIWRRENEVREKVDLPPIKYKQAYFRHTADAMAKEMLEGKYPFPQGIKYWSEKMVGKKIFNPMEFQRKLSDDLIDIWSKDIRAVTKSMLWNGLKEIYLAQPAKFLNEQLNAISKDLPEYKNLSPRDKASYDQTRVMPASTRKWLIDYINQVMKGQETELDASLNRIVTKSGLKGIFDKALIPFGRSIGRKPITNLFVLSGRAVISGVMGWVPRQIIRNAFQQVQNLALYGVKATIKAFLPASIDKNLKVLLSESLFLKSYTGYEELPTNLMGKLEKVWLGPYGIVAVNNAKQGMKAAYWNILELIKNPKFKKHGWADPQRTKDTPKGLLYPSEKEKLLKEMEFGSSCTQYQYIPMGMPGVFRYKALVPLTRLQSWWMNYFTKFNREAIHRAFKGRPSWSGEDGPTLPWSRRVNWLKYLVIGGAVLTAMGYKRSFMIGVLPVYISPAGQVALGIYNYATADADWKREKALRQIYYSWKAFIPGSLAWRDFVAVWTGEKELEEILFYGKKEEKKVQPPLKITILESKKLKFIEPKIKIESKKLKFNF